MQSVPVACSFSVVSLCTCSVQHQPPLAISPRGVSLVRFCSFSDSRFLFLIRVFLIHVCVFPVICSRSASYALIQGPFFRYFHAGFILEAIPGPPGADSDKLLWSQAPPILRSCSNRYVDFICMIFLLPWPHGKNSTGSLAFSRIWHSSSI